MKKEKNINYNYYNCYSITWYNIIYIFLEKRILKKKNLAIFKLKKKKNKH